MKFPRNHRFAYALVGVFLGLGAPLGSMAIRLSLHDQASLWARMVYEWQSASYFYIYMTLGTVTAFTLFGYVLGKKGDALEKEKKRVGALAVKDGLTGLYNHRYLQDHLKAELDRAKRYSTELTCAMLDIDNFKTVNDSQGHVFGDHVLRVVARILREQIRRVDTAGRYGGEEFLIIMPHTNAKEVLPVAERIRVELQDFPFHSNGQEVHVTISIGMATQSPRAQDFKDKETFLRSADAALYEAKKLGKNRTHISPPKTD